MNIKDKFLEFVGDFYTARLNASGLRIKSNNGKNATEILANGISTNGNVVANQLHADNGASGAFTDKNGKVVQVVNGIIVNLDYKK